MPASHWIGENPQYQRQSDSIVTVDAVGDTMGSRSATRTSRNPLMAGTSGSPWLAVADKSTGLFGSLALLRWARVRCVVRWCVSG